MTEGRSIWRLFAGRTVCRAARRVPTAQLREGWGAQPQRVMPTGVNRERGVSATDAARGVAWPRARSGHTYLERCMGAALYSALLCSVEDGGGHGTVGTL